MSATNNPKTGEAASVPMDTAHNVSGATSDSSKD